jgi:protein-L-isoaspartate(D-aspartate) O-methyltransferase
VPEALLERLSIGGRLVAIVGELPIMSAQLITRVAERQFSAENLFDTVALPLVDFPRKENFVF